MGVLLLALSDAEVTLEMHRVNENAQKTRKEKIPIPIWKILTTWVVLKTIKMIHFPKVLHTNRTSTKMALVWCASCWGLVDAIWLLYYHKMAPINSLILLKIHHNQLRDKPIFLYSFCVVMVFLLLPDSIGIY